MTIEHLTPNQIKTLVLYHAANSRFHNTQVALLREITQPEMGHDNVFEPLAQHHEKMAKKHQDTAEKLNSKLGTTQSVNLE